MTDDRNALQPMQITELTSSVMRRQPLEIPFLLTDEEASRAVAEKEIQLRNHKRWVLMTRGCDTHMADRIIEDTDWTELYDRDTVIQAANRLKYWKIEDERIQAERKAREEEQRTNLLRLWSAEKMHGLIAGVAYREYGKELIVNEHTLPLIKILCFRLSDDPRYQTEIGLDPSKGILLKGGTGVGKTFVISCARSNPIHPVQMHSMIDIAESIRTTGTYLSGVIDTSSIMYIDDVGTEYDRASKSIKHYGSEINWFKNFIEGYYSRSRNGFSRLIISTNDSFDTLEAKYGFRVRSRLAEMFNIVTVTGPDMRKLNINITHG